MSSKVNHEELIQRFPALQQIEESIRKHILDVFANAKNGEPNAISRAGCLALALKSNEVGRAVGEDKTHVLWNAWRNAFPTKGSNANRVDFSGVRFRKVPLKPNLSFAAMEFGDFANFRAAQFDYYPIFKAAQFGNFATFTAVHFRNGVAFTAAQFGEHADFCGAQFGPDAGFAAAQFGRMAKFQATHFERLADFSARTWAQVGGVYGARLKAVEEWAGNHGLSPETFQKIDFSGTVFSGKADFSDRKFLGETAFGCLTSDYTYEDLKRDEKQIPIVNDAGCHKIEKKRPNQFHVSFGVSPIFHGCELHQDISFKDAVFPAATGNENSANAYRTLKLAFSKQQAIREEHRFFRLEMEEETLRETGLKRALFRAYRTFSDYGFSITRPLRYWGLGVLVLTVVYGLLSWLGQCGLSTLACDFTPKWLEFSLLQTLPLPGLEKLSGNASEAFWPEGAWWGLGLSVLVILHKTLSLAALFLIGLALRNLFKLK